MSSDKQDSVKIAKLGGALDFIEWKRSMKAFLRRDDYLLLGLQESPSSTTQSAVTSWRKAQTIAKANITYI